MIFDSNNLKELYLNVKKDEEYNKELLSKFNEDYPKIITRENINTVLKQLIKKDL